MRYLIVYAVLLIAFSGCRGNEDVTMQVEVEEYIGKYTVRDVRVVEEAQRVDSVIFSVTNQTSYRLHFYDASEDGVDFCDCSGSVIGYGSSTVTFAPTSVSLQNCDTLRIPRGDFAADYVNHRDTIYYERRTTDSIYQLIVLD